MNAITNTSLRMRVIDDYNNPIVNACDPTYRGQCEDYIVIINDSAGVPEADFDVLENELSVNSVVHFYDLTLNQPTSWEWTFDNAYPSTSTLQHPTVIYQTPGIYSATLTTSNAFGESTITKFNYIEVTVAPDTMCSQYFSNQNEGIFYDSGGPSGNYLTQQFCSYLIQPLCATEITLQFTQFYVGNDTLKVYDGDSENAPLLAAWSTYNPPTAITATSGSMYIAFISYDNTWGSGFIANWSSIVSTDTESVVASFNVSDYNPSVGMPVSFGNLSEGNYHTLLWDFGAGNSSLLENPEITFEQPGTYTATLHIWGCYSYDTSVVQIEVQEFPVLDVLPESINLNVDCNTASGFELQLTNSGAGEMFWTCEGSGIIDSVQLLVFDYSIPASTISFITNSLSLHFPDYIYSETNTFDPEVLSQQLAGKDVFLLIRDPAFPADFYLNMAAPLQNFVSNGGTLISLDPYGINFEDLGIVEFEYSSNNYSTVYVIDTDHPLAQNVSPIYEEGGSGDWNILNANAQKVVVNQLNHDIATLIPFGEGKFIHLDYFPSSYVSQNRVQLFANAVKLGRKQIPSWIELPSDDNSILPGSSQTVQVLLDPNEMESGTYHFQLYFQANNQEDLRDTVDVTLVLNGTGIITAPIACLDLGEVFTTTDSSMVIYNSGCAPFDIESINVSNPEVIFEDVTAVVAPHDSLTIPFSFSPVEIGSSTTAVEFQSSAGTANSCIITNAVPPPILTISADTLIFNIPCNSISTHSIQIGNSGYSNLIAELDHSTVPDTTTKVLILGALNTGAGIGNITDALNNTPGEFDVFMTYNTSLSSISALLAQNDVVIIGEPSSSNSTFYNSLSEVLPDFVNNGGKVILLGSEYHTPNNLDLMTISQSFNPIISYIHVQDSTHYITKNIPTSFIDVTNTYSAASLGQGKIELLSSELGNDVLTLFPIGEGMAIYMGFTMQESNAIVDTLLARCTRYVAPPDWITPTDTTLTLLQDSIGTFEITFNTNGFTNNQYNYNLELTSNDPLVESLIIPIVVNVTGSGQFDLITECVAFEEIIVNTSAQEQIYFSNLGCASFDILSYSLNTQHYTPGPIEEIDAYESESLLINFTPTESGYWLDTLVIHTTVGDYEVCLSGNALPAPEYFGPASINVENVDACGQAMDSFFEIQNSGLLDLDCHIISSIPDWLLIATDFTVAQQSSFSIPFTIDPSGFNGGEYSFNLQFTTNDPENPLVMIPFGISITSIPCVSFQHHQHCNGLTTFQNTTYNLVDTYLWDFGDGTTSNEINPVHIFSENGSYSVTLTACYENQCDTYTEQVVAEISNTELPLIQCIPATNASSENVLLSLIVENSTMYNSDTYFYVDKTCSNLILLEQFHEYTITPTATNNSDIQFWIDYNNNGEFDANEAALSSLDNSTIINLDQEVVLNTPLRMRVIVEQNNLISNFQSTVDACYSPEFGQVVDYRVIIIVNDNPPVCDFTLSNSNCSLYANYYDISENSASTEWNFGNDDIFSDESGTYQFDQPGLYTISLTCMNNVDTITVSQELEVNYAFDEFDYTGSQAIDSTITFTALSDIMSSYEWYTNNEGPFTGPTFSYVYENPGTYAVTLYVTDGNCDNSQTQYISIGITSIDEVESVSDFVVIYPNPATDLLNISLPVLNDGLEYIAIHDAHGKIVFKKQMDMKSPFSYELQLPKTISQGIYSLSLTLKNGVITKPFIVN
jgi:PKD repeat protein